MELQAAHNTSYTYMHGMGPVTAISKDVGMAGTSSRSGTGIGAVGVEAIQLVLPTDVKKQRKQVKQIFSDRGSSFEVDRTCVTRFDKSFFSVRSFSKSQIFHSQYAYHRHRRATSRFRYDVSIIAMAHG